MNQKASRYMLLFYASMLLVPLLLLADTVATAYGAALYTKIVSGLVALGLAVYAITGFVEVYWNSGGRAEGLNPTVEKRPVYKKLEISRGERIIDIRVRRYNAQEERFEDMQYKVKANRFTTVLDALIAIKAGQDNTLAVRYSCRMGICGSCGMVIDGKPRLACETSVFDISGGDKVVVEPMRAHPLLKDLVTDFDDFFEKHMSAEPGLYRKDRKEQDKAASVYKQSRKERDAYLPYSYCIMCGLCLDACPVVNSNPKFVGPQALSQVYRYHKDSRDQKGEKRLGIMDSLEGVWGCEFAGACSEVCPKGVDPAGAIQALKFDIFKERGIEADR